MTPGFDREVPPPPRLKERVVRSLRGAGVLSSARTSRGRRFVGVAAALLVGFGLGYAARPRMGEPPKPASEQRYALLLYADSSFRDEGSGAERVAEYARWARALRSRGQFELGERLARSGRVVASGPASPDVGAGTVASLGTVAGLFIIRAADMAEAITLASTCPHVRYGGRIVVQAIAPT